MGEVGWVGRQWGNGARSPLGSLGTEGQGAKGPRLRRALTSLAKLQAGLQH